MALSLIEEFLLLSQDGDGEFGNIPETSLACGIAAAALMDLAIRGKIDSDLDSLWVVDQTPTDSETLNAVLEAIAQEPGKLHHDIWIRRLMAESLKFRRDALDSLCAKGILRREDHRFLWVTSGAGYQIHQTEARGSIKRDVLALLFNREIPEPREISLIALADACGIFERILAPSTLEETRSRIQQIRRMDLIGAGIALTAGQMNKQIKQAERRIILAGAAGNVMEWYDFSVYGFFAGIIGQQFFPAHNPLTSLLASFGVFAVGFVGRPLGALVLGQMGDSHGRRTALMRSVLFMACPTLLMGLLPTYGQIGIIAPVLLIVLRFSQGIAVGGEYTTSMVLLVEGSQRSRRGLIGSFAPVGAMGGTLLGSVIGGLLTEMLSRDASALWGWRAAFLLGMVLGVFVIMMRRQLPADEVVRTIQDRRSSPIMTVLREERPILFKIIGILLVQAIGYYLFFVYLTTWVTQYAGIDRSAALLINGAALAVALIALPIFGHISDRFGRKRQLMAGALAVALFAWPLMHLIGQGSVIGVLLGQCLFSVLYASIAGCFDSFVVELIPKRVRCSALSISYNIALAGFGGTVPLVSIFLISETGYRLSPAIYLALAGLVSFLASSMTEMTKEEQQYTV